jgi:hypothetical protein
VYVAADLQVLPEVDPVSVQLDGILDAIASAPDLERGLCVGQFDLFDNTEDPAAVELALSLCAQCSVRDQCAEYVAGLSPRKRPIGVIAGAVRKPAA